MVGVPINKKEIVGLVEAQAKSIDSISERLVKIENLADFVEKQESRNKDIIIAVLIAFILVVGTVAVEVILSNRSDKQFYSQLQKDVYEQSAKVKDVNDRLDNLKIRNSYLK